MMIRCTPRRLTWALCGRDNPSIWFLLAAGFSGCAGAPPKLFPATAIERHVLSTGGVERCFDTDGDGKIDYAERLGPAGQVEALLYDRDNEGRFGSEVILSQIDDAEKRDLILLLDSVPYGMVSEMWDGERLRFFPRPSRVIAPFPVMTDISFCEFFGVACPGVEAEYFNGQKLTSGYETYASGGNVPWQKTVGYRLNPMLHTVAYLDSYEWYLHELRRIRESFLSTDSRRYIGYVVGTSALGAAHGRDGHQVGLDQLDRYCQQLMHDTRGRLRLTLLSDHGHNLVPSTRLKLVDIMTRLGYRVSERLDEPGDIVLPQFGMVTYASIHTREPQRVAGDIAGVEGVDWAAYVEPNGDLIVVGQGSRARISRTEPDGSASIHDGRARPGVRYRYVAVAGDPLKLRSIIESLSSRGLVASDGFIDDAALFEAVKSHIYPDAVHRLWRAFHGGVEHTPDVMVDVEDGFHSGSAFMTMMLPLKAAHGNLGLRSSSAFCMTTAGELPPVVRMESLRGELIKRGIRLGEDAAAVPAR